MRCAAVPRQALSRLTPGALSGVILGLYRGYIGIMEKKMETTIVLRGHIGVI